MDFSDTDQRNGVLGAAAGFALSFVAAPILRFIIPLVAIIVLALLFGRMDDHFKARFGIIGSALAAGVAFLLQPLRELAEGALKGLLSLFVCFLMTVLGYLAGQVVFQYSEADEEE
jgi:hypothetical protein